MAFNKWNGAPTPDKIVFGKYNYHRMWILNPAAAAAPLTPVEVLGVQNINSGPMTPGTTKNFMQQSGGDEKYVYRSDYEFEITVNMLSGDVPTFIANLYSRTLGATDGYALPMRAHAYPLIIWEAVCRMPDGTHLFSEVWQDLILSSWTVSQPMEDGTTDITFFGHHDSFLLYKNAQIVVDQFDGDDSTTNFTLSSSPLKCLDASDLQHEDWTLDNLIYVKEKTSSQNTGVRILSGASLTGTDLDVSGYGTPATGSIITAAYIAAVA